MRVAFYIFCFVGIVCSCANKKDNEPTPPFTYRSSMMNQTLKKGTTYDVQRQTHYKLNDIVLYTYTDLFYGKEMRVAGRVVGVPGDTVVFVAGQVIRNNRIFLMPNTTQYHYLVKFNKKDETMFSEFNIGGNTGDIYDCFLTKTDSLRLVQKYKDFVLSIKKSPLEMNNEVLLNNQNKFGWNMDDFGPVVIPKIDSRMTTDSAKIFVNKKITDKNVGDITITEPLYFIVCDNFDDCTTDSRSVGLISNSQIEGSLKLPNK